MLLPERFYRGIIAAHLAFGIGLRAGAVLAGHEGPMYVVGQEHGTAMRLVGFVKPVGAAEREQLERGLRIALLEGALLGSVLGAVAVELDALDWAPDPWREVQAELKALDEAAVGLARLRANAPPGPTAARAYARPALPRRPPLRASGPMTATHDVYLVPPTCVLCGDKIRRGERSMDVWLHRSPDGVPAQGPAHVECVAPSPQGELPEPSHHDP